MKKWVKAKKDSDIWLANRFGESVVGCFEYEEGASYSGKWTRYFLDGETNVISGWPISSYATVLSGNHEACTEEEAMEIIGKINPSMIEKLKPEPVVESCTNSIMELEL